MDQYGGFADESEPPSQEIQQQSFQDALARARQIAQKIGTTDGSSGSGDAPTSGVKRPYNDDNNPFAVEEPGIKRSNPPASAHDKIGAQLEALANQSRGTSAAIQAAAAAASQINAKLGATVAGPPPAVGPGIGGGSLGPVLNDNYQVPDRMVGLLIGKGGEQIATIQAETGCKVQFAPESNGTSQRPCQLTGNPEAIKKAKDMIQNIIMRGQGNPDAAAVMDGQTMIEMMIPGNKVGLIIGKGGETIRNLQEQAGVKMVMIQDTNQPGVHQKPLRISGDLVRCQKAQQYVMELISEKDVKLPVPRSVVGVVIGKGGEMIRKIQAEYNAKVQFLPDDGTGPDRICSISGSPDTLQTAVAYVQGLVNQSLTGRKPGMEQFPPGGGNNGGGGGDNNVGAYGPPRPGPGPSGPPPGHGGPPPGHGGPGPGAYGNGAHNNDGPIETTTYSVPADKCGLVIGKGGETIREINRQSGAHVELNRGPGPSEHEKSFNLRGTSQQIHQAMTMIAEKTGQPPPANNAPFDALAQIAAYNHQWNYGGNGNNGGNNDYWAQQQQPNHQSSQSKQQQQTDNAAAWAAYYAHFYNQQNNQMNGSSSGNSGPAPPPAPPQQQQSNNYNSQGNNSSAGQPDYSAAWAEYYRQQGMHHHAAAIQQQQPGQQGASSQPPHSHSQTHGQPMGGPHNSHGQSHASAHQHQGHPGGPPPAPPH